MAKTNWTKEQLDAIKTRNCNLLVAAAAGSGKTAVLVERIIQIITDPINPVDIDKLLVVTFTNAAASEMREKIAEAISKALEETPESKNLQNQLTLLSRANITTMHSFCLDVIKNNYQIIDLDPSFRILDQTEGELLKTDILESLFEDKYEEEDKGFLDLIEAYSGSKDDNKIKEMVLDLYKFSMSGPWPEKWLNEKSEEFNLKDIDELNKSKWYEVLSNNLKIQLEGLITMDEKAKEICDTTSGLEPYCENFQSDIDEINVIYDSIDQGIKEVYSKLNLINFSRLKSVKKDKVSDPESQDKVKKIRDDVKKSINTIKEKIFLIDPDQTLLNIQNCYPFVKKLTDLVIEFEERFSDSKKDKGVLDFNDLEHYCLKILTKEGFDVSAKFKDYFDEVLVDEYQDSNNVQEEILNLVSRKSDENPNLFMVGDVKQSIYRFRQAKPELFLQKYNSYSKEKGDNRLIQLYKNFRSRNEVINGVNYIFKELMSSNVGELEYTDEESLNLGADYPEYVNDEGKIELNILSKNDDSNQELDLEDQVDAMQLEARIVALRIKEIINGKDDKQFMVFDKNEKKYRKPSYKDIVILLRATKNWAEIFLDEIGSNGIPIYADTNTGYFESIEIRTILSLLKVIDNPLQDVPVIAVLRSPIFDFKADQLSKIRLLDKNKYYYQNIKMASFEETDLDEELKNKCRNFIERINIWREREVYTPIDEFIWSIYTDTAYYGYVGAMPNGVLRQANLRILFQRAKQYEETSFKGLFNFINFINKIRKSSGDMGSAKILGENEDVVRIMSIHKSKGLEFPIVFLSGSGKNFNMMDLNKTVLYHDELGIGPNYVDLENRISYSTFPKEAIKQKMKLETLSEEMRILYVAFTRAKEKLIITGATSDIQKLSERISSSAELSNDVILPSEVAKGKSYLEWICMALFMHKDGEVLRNYVENPVINIVPDLSTWKTKIWTFKDLIVDNLSENIKEGSSCKLFIEKESDCISEKIKSRLDYQYKYQNSTKIKSNFSVSDLKKKNYEEDEYTEGVKLYKEASFNKPKFIQESKGLTPSEKGTAMHFVMKKIDYTKELNKEEIDLQLKSLLERDLISYPEYKSINSSKVLSFFESSLGKRLVKSEKVYRELPFYTEISSTETDRNLPDNMKDEMVRLQGVIDCFFYEGDNVILLDYKTDYVKEGNEEELISKYSIQIKLYKDALEKITGNKVNECYLYSFTLDKEIKMII